MKPTEEFHFPQNNNLASNFMILLPCALTIFCLWISCRIWAHSLTLPTHPVSRRRKFFRDPIRRPFLAHQRPSTPSFQTPENESLEFTPRKVAGWLTLILFLHITASSIPISLLLRTFSILLGDISISNVKRTFSGKFLFRKMVSDYSICRYP